MGYKRKMTANGIEPSTPTTRSLSPRIVSIDIFRGLTIAVMIFVNALSDVPGLPWWTYHAHASQDVMTYVDMVFPFFLFIVGMSLPLSVAQRLKRNPSLPSLWLHVFLRFVSLLVLGLILANADKADPVRMGIDGNLWGLLGLVSAALYLNVYPKSVRYPHYSTVLRCIGLIGVVILFAIFRRQTDGGHAAWIDPSYPEILGLIAFTYLAVALLYIPTRGWKWAASVFFVLLLGLNLCSAGKLLAFPDRLPLWYWPFGNGAMSCIVMAGVVTSQIFLGIDRRPPVKRAIALSVCLAIVSLLLGWLSIPLGISKIRATPTWSLWSIGAAMLLFALIFWICDVKGWTAWAFLFRPAGSNTLLTYLLPDIWDFLLASLGITYLDTHLRFGAAGVWKTAAFTVCMLMLASLLTRAKLRFQL
jgi:predicted acyltransferase